MKTLITFLLFLSNSAWSGDAVVPLICKYSNGNKPADRPCVPFNPIIKKTVNGVCLYNDKGSSSSKSWQRGNLVYTKNTDTFKFVPAISCDNGIEYKLVPDVTSDKSIANVLSGKPNPIGYAAYQAGKAPTTCYISLSGIGVPYSPKPCSGSSADANYCRIIKDRTPSWPGSWWYHGTGFQICKGGVAFGDTPGIDQDTEYIITDGSTNIQGEPFKCIRADANNLPTQYLCDQNACKVSGHIEGAKGCCRNKLNSKNVPTWVQNTNSPKLTAIPYKPTTATCSTLISVKKEIGNPPDSSNDLFAGGVGVSLTDATTGLMIKDKDFNFTIDNIIKVTIDQSGKMGINTLSDPLLSLNVLGDVRFNGNLKIDKDATALSFLTPSDRSLKENIIKIDHPLEKINKLNGVYYFWNKAIAGDSYPNDRQTGLIAQDVEQVMPELVKKRSDGKLTVDYSHAIGLLIEGLKELKKENEVLKKRIIKLEDESK